jgi:transposase-like protein
VRSWGRKFGQAYAKALRQRHPRPGDKWHLDEVFLTVHGERQYLWRAVDQDGYVLDILVQRRRDRHAAKKFFRPKRHLLPAPVYRQEMRHRFQAWQEITATPLAA